MLDFLFGGSAAKKKQQRTPHPFPSASSSSSVALPSSSSTFPPSASSSPYGPGDESVYDDVALGGGDLGGGGMASQSRNSLSDGTFVGSSSASSASALASGAVSPALSSRAVPLSDPDDFVLYSLDEAAHIAYAIHVAFGVELDKEVVLAAANVKKLATRVAEARKVLGLKPGEAGTGMKADLRVA